MRLTPKKRSFGLSPVCDLNSQLVMMWLSKTLSSLAAKNLPGLYVAIIKSACTEFATKLSEICLPGVISVPKCQVVHGYADHLVLCGLTLLFSQSLISEPIIFERVFVVFEVDRGARGAYNSSLGDEGSVREREWDQGFSRQGS